MLVIYYWVKTKPGFLGQKLYIYIDFTRDKSIITSS